MEALRERERASEPWSLRSDRQLLTALQDLSGDIMASVRRLEAGVSGLETDAARLETGVSTAHAAFRELSHAKFVEQVVASEAPAATQPPRQRAPLLTAENFAEIVHPKYREALALASAALEQHAAPSVGRLPFIFGSPEYLQDASFGIRDVPRDAAAQQAQAEETEGTEAAVARDNGASESQEAAAVPDFKSLLEAALRGDLDESAAEALAVDSPASEAAPPGRRAAATQDSSPETGEEQARQAQRSDTGGITASLKPALSLEELLEGEGELFSEEELRS